MSDLDYRHLRATVVGITKAEQMTAQLEADGWVLLEQHCTMGEKEVRLVFGSNERSAGLPR